MDPRTKNKIDNWIIKGGRFTIKAVAVAITTVIAYACIPGPLGIDAAVVAGGVPLDDLHENKG